MKIYWFEDKKNSYFARHSSNFYPVFVFSLEEVKEIKAHIKEGRKLYDYDFDYDEMEVISFEINLESEEIIKEFHWYIWELFDAHETVSIYKVVKTTNKIIKMIK